jgi:membrane-associated HD superfamily phosphohydrolase
MDFIIVQGIGFIALILTIISFQQKQRNGILKIQVFSSSLYSIHFFLLNALAGAIMNFITIFRSYIFHQKTSKKWANKKIWLYTFLAIIITSSYFTWQNIYSILPAIALFIGTIAYWQKDAKKVRAISLFSRPFWLIYNILVLSIPGIIVEILILTSTIIGIIRLDLEKSVSASYATQLFHNCLGTLRFRTSSSPSFNKGLKKKSSARIFPKSLRDFFKP